MTDFHSLIVNRRSIRRYTEQEITAQDVKTIMEAALLAPTSRNLHSWHFVLIEDPDKLVALSKCREEGAGPVAHAALAIVVAVDVEATDPWLEDASIAATYIQLQAADLGLASCWIQVFGRYTHDDIQSETYVQNLLDMPDTIIPICIVTLGHPAEERPPHDIAELRWDKVHIGAWSER